jgi:anaerobic selenocysteine-containing dehydrogenase
MTEHVQGTEGIMALVNFALLTGNIGRPAAASTRWWAEQRSAAAHGRAEAVTGYVPITFHRNSSCVACADSDASRLNMVDMMDGGR